MIGSYQWKGKMALLNIVMIGLSNELPKHDEKYELHRLLGTLLLEELTVEERLDIIENEYDIPTGENIRKDQCNKFASAVKNKSDKEAIDYNIFDNNRVPINNSKKQQ